MHFRFARIVVLLFLLLSSQLFAAKIFQPCTWGYVTQFVEPKIEQIVGENGAEVLGTGKSSGSVTRYRFGGTATRTIKQYIEGTKSPAKKDHRRLEILRALNLTTVSVPITRVVKASELGFLERRKEFSGSKVLEFIDQIDGFSVERTYRILKDVAPKVAWDFALEWNAFISMLSVDIRNRTLSKGTMFALGRRVLESLKSGKPKDDWLSRDLEAIQFALSPTRKLPELRYYIHADNVIIEWATGEAWVVDPW